MSPDSSCPSTQELEAFTEGRLTGGDLTRVLNHLTSCPACQDEFRRLSSRGDGSQPQAKEPALGKLQGSTLGQYQLLEPVGGGGMGVVYKALHTRLKQVVALKTMTRAALADPQAQARFQREMAALGGLIHPNIVRATDAGEAEGWHYLVMEFVEGIDLNQLVKLCGPLRMADACELIRQAANGLQFIHENKRVHRDLKPSNLMLTLDGQIKILDLGLALLHEDQDELTSSRQVMGTADFMAPEQARSAHDVDIRADLYSLGCTLYKLLTGVAPFNWAGPERKGKLAAHAELPPPALGEARSDVSGAVSALVDRLLAKDPADRFQQPRELAAALAASTSGHDLVALAQTAHALRAKQGDGDAGPRKETVPFHLGAQHALNSKSTPTPREASQPVPGSRRKTWLAVAVLAVFVCLLGVGIGWRLMRQEIEDNLPWPADYPAALKDLPWSKPIALVDKKAGRARDAADDFRGINNASEQTYQPLWRRRALGAGKYYEANLDMALYAMVPPGLTFMELSHDLRKRWFELDAEVMSLVPADWLGGLYFGWQEATPGMAETYVLLHERGRHAEPLQANLVHLAAVQVKWQRADAAEPIYPFKPIKQQKVVTLKAPAPPDQRFARIRLRATPGRLTVTVNGGDSVTLAPVIDPRGALGLWVQQGWAFCGRLILTSLPGPWAE